MKNSRLLLFFVPLGMLGCASPGRLLTDLAGTGAGAVIANQFSHGNPAITGLGAAGGLAVGEGLNLLQTKAESKAFTDGYNKGRSDSIKAQYWMQMNLHRPPQFRDPIFPSQFPLAETGSGNSTNRHFRSQP